jgi:V/A-type H+/Na+-transporting ATPase subunit D
MGELKFTKKTLREEQRKLTQLETYLPTLQLKKKLLQFEVTNCHNVIEDLFKKFQRVGNEVDKIASLFSHGEEVVTNLAHIQHIEKVYENIAGVELPKFMGVSFSRDSYSLFDTPLWTDSALDILREMIKIKQQMSIEEEKKRALLRELNEVSIRLNLFEKILIPRKKKNIKRIGIFLGDQELAAVAQAKIAKTKILEKSIK